MFGEQFTTQIQPPRYSARKLADEIRMEIFGKETQVLSEELQRLLKLDESILQRIPHIFEVRMGEVASLDPDRREVLIRRLTDELTILIRDDTYFVENPSTEQQEILSEIGFILRELTPHEVVKLSMGY